MAVTEMSTKAYSFEQESRRSRQQEFDEDIPVKLIMVDNTARGRHPHTLPEAPISRFKAFETV